MTLLRAISAYTEDFDIPTVAEYFDTLLKEASDEFYEHLMKTSPQKRRLAYKKAEQKILCEFKARGIYCDEVPVFGLINSFLNTAIGYSGEKCPKVDRLRDIIDLRFCQNPLYYVSLKHFLAELIEVGDEQIDATP